MSETFLIKQTSYDAAASAAVRTAASFIIGPGELDGPGGLVTSSELRLFGFGSSRWGEAVNQNVFRLLENNACPPKVLGDFNPISGLNDYDPGTDPILPKDGNDLGIGNGITLPVIGQSWFNIIDQLSYNYTSGGWTAPGSGGSTITGTLNMSGFNIINVADPTDLPNTLPGSILAPQDAVNVGWADQRFVNRTGDSMTGPLNLNSNQLTNVGAPVAGTSGMSRNYADGRYVNVTGDTMSGNLDMGSSQITNLAAPTTGTDALNRDAADARYINVTDDTMSGTLSLGGLPAPGGASGVILRTHSPNPGGSFQQFTNLLTGTTIGTDGFLIGIDAAGQAILTNREATDMLFRTSGIQRMRIAAAGPVTFDTAVPTFAGAEMWHPSNDGPSSGLDADTVDGFHASAFLTSVSAHSYTSIFGASQNFGNFALAASMLLEAGVPYLIGAYGVIANRGTAFNTLNAVRIYNGSPTLISTLSSNVGINWPDGNAPMSVTTIFVPPVTTEYRILFDASNWAMQYSFMRLTH